MPPTPRGIPSPRPALSAIACVLILGSWAIGQLSLNEEVRVTREHAKGDVAARGSASDLLLFIWGRIPPSRLEVFGDAAALERFRGAIRV